MIKYYMHGGSENHGCEAIVRSTTRILECDPVLYSTHPSMDHHYDLDQICEIRARGGEIKKYTPKWAAYQFAHKILKRKTVIMNHTYSRVISEAGEGDVYLSIGGDNYCGKLVPALKYVNRRINEQGASTVLWGCSIDPEFILNPANQDDLARYKAIFARERMTYNALVEAGLGNTAHYHPDPAFNLQPEVWDLPEAFKNHKVIGINISPYVEKNGKGDNVFRNYVRMINYILARTDMYVALIPHVIWAESDDRKPLDKLAEKYADNDRVIYIQDQNCQRLKYAISKCYMLVTARTHASIAGYSTCVPTLVVGYSMKSRGIALDLFGTTDHYVVNAWDMEDRDALLKAFIWQFRHRDEVKAHLEAIMPEYIENSRKAADELKKLL